MQVPTEAEPDIAYPCRIAASPTIHLTRGTVDGKRGDTVCGLGDFLIPTEEDAVTCEYCREATSRPGARTD